MSDIPNSAVALLSFYTPDFQSLHDVTGPVKDAYCAKHGYNHIVRATPYRANPGYYAYDRLAYLRDLLFGIDGPSWRDALRPEVVLVLNGHAQVMTHTLTVQSFLDPDHDFYIDRDVNGLNAGAFLVRRSDWLRDWLDHLLSIEGAYEAREWHEQNAMQDSWQLPQFRSRISVAELGRLQSYLWGHYNWSPTTPGEFRPGKSFVLHIPGRSVFHPEPTPLVQTRVKLFSSPEIVDAIVY